VLALVVGRRGREGLGVRAVVEARGCSVNMPGWMLSREKKLPWW
jgi:hypothetical protein